jgi:hypothetical protein
VWFNSRRRLQLFRKTALTARRVSRAAIEQRGCGCPTAAARVHSFHSFHSWMPNSSSPTQAAAPGYKNQPGVCPEKVQYPLKPPSSHTRRDTYRVPPPPSPSRLFGLPTPRLIHRHSAISACGWAGCAQFAHSSTATSSSKQLPALQHDIYAGQGCTMGEYGGGIRSGIRCCS